LERAKSEIGADLSRLSQNWCVVLVVISGDGCCLHKKNPSATGWWKIWLVMKPCL